MHLGRADTWVSFSRPLMGGLAAGAQDAVSRNWVPSALSDSLVCLIPGLLPPPSCGVFPLILWERERGIFFSFFFLAASCTAGKPGTHRPPQETPGVLWLSETPPWAQAMPAKFPSPTAPCPHLYIFFLQCRNVSSAEHELLKSLLVVAVGHVHVHDCSQTAANRV